MAGKSKTETELELLTALEDGEVVSQLSLSKRVSASVGLVNAVLKRAVHKGTVKVKAVPYQRYAYYLTPKGFTEKSRLVAEYLETSLEFFRRTRAEYLALLVRARACGARRVVLVGQGELVEIALLAAREAEIEVAAIFDRETNVDRIHGLAVMRGVDSFVAESDVVLVTASRHPQEAYDRARACFGDERVLVPAFLRVARKPGES